jgi:hypothetical protein
MKAIAINPNHTNAHCDLGHALDRQGDFAGAAATRQAALVVCRCTIGFSNDGSAVCSGCACMIALASECDAKVVVCGRIVGSSGDGSPVCSFLSASPRLQCAIETLSSVIITLLRSTAAPAKCKLCYCKWVIASWPLSATPRLKCVIALLGSMALALLYGAAAPAQFLTLPSTTLRLDCVFA